MYQCKLCPKSFKSANALNSHQKVHKDGYTNKGYLTGAGKYIQDTKQKRVALYNSNPATCGECGVPLTYEQHSKQQAYCGRSCAAKYNNANRILSSKVLLPNRICEQCNIPFRGGHSRRFCTDKCKQTYRATHPRIITDKGRQGLREAGQRSAEIQQHTKRSINEVRFFNMCYGEFSNVTNNERYFNGWDADVILHDFKVAVLWNGPWHYKKLTKKHSVEQVQNRDRIKLHEIEKAGYISYVIRDDSRKGTAANQIFVEQQFDTFVEWLQSLGIEPSTFAL